MRENQGSSEAATALKRARNTLTKENLMENDEPCRSLVCDENGIIIAETAYKCMKCGLISDTIKDAKSHYYEAHIDEEIPGFNDFEITNNDDDVNIDTRRVNNFNYGSSSNNNNNTSNNNNSDSFSLLNDKRKRKRNTFQNGLSGGKCFETHDLSRTSSDNLALNLTKYVDENQEPGKLLALMSSTNTSSNSSTKKTARNFPNNDYSLEADWIKSSNILPRGSTTGSVGRAGYVSCAVCGVVRYYSCVYRRYGKFTCQVCYRFFRTFFTKPKVYSCANLGLCPLDVRVRCRACWILACTNLYTVRGDRKQILDSYRPWKADKNDMSKYEASSLSNLMVTEGVDEDDVEADDVEGEDLSLKIEDVEGEDLRLKIEYEEEEAEEASKTSESSNQLEKDSQNEQLPSQKVIKTEQLSSSN